MAKSPNSTYWDKRAIERMTEAEKSSEEYIKKVNKIYNRANRDIQKQIATIYKNYSRETGLSTQELRTLLSKKETDKFWKTLEGKGLKPYVKTNYKARISRLEQLQAQLYVRAKEIAPLENKESTINYNGVINKSYNKVMYDTQMGTGYDFAFNKLDNRTIDTILNNKWSGKNYSERIWGNTDILANKLSTVLGGAMISGQSQAKTIKEIKDAFNVSKYYAERLIRTETNHFNNEAEYEAYQELGLEQYVFVATLDNRTSSTCQEHDNKIYSLKDRNIGVNYPPLHPNCRSTVRAYMDKDYEPLKRRAKNPITGKTELVDNIPYSEWIKHHNIENVKSGRAISTEGIKYNTKSLSKLDKTLVDSNTSRLSELVNKYPKVREFIKDNDFTFGAKTTNAIAVTSHTYDMKNQGIFLSNDYYSKNKNYTKAIRNGVKSGNFMPCADNNINVYALNHEFGHLLENCLINEYNINNPIEYESFKKKLKFTTSQYDVHKTVRDYETNITDKIAQDIYNIAQKNNKDFNINTNLSNYGKSSSQEFFAECFANMESGKPNELGIATKEYLKGVM